MFNPSVSKESLALMNKALSNPLDGTSLSKAGITQAGNITFYDLRAPALLHVPMLTPLRDMLPRRSIANAGLVANWKQIRSMTGSGFDSMGYVPEGQRSGTMSISASNKSASYVTIGEEGAVSFEAEAAARGFEDANALARFTTLEKTMLKEEAALLFGNKTIALGTPATPTTSAPTAAGESITDTTYYVAVVALTGQGVMNSSIAGGVAVQKTITGADGNTFVINGGSSALSAIQTQVVGSGDALAATVTAIKGAVGYAWYVGTTNAAGSLHLQSITALNSFVLTTDPATTTQLASAITGDHSLNDGTTGGTTVSAYDGLLTSALVSGSGAYYKALATGTAGTGTSLTSTNSGSIAEIDEMLLSMWDADRLSVDNLWMSARTAKKVRDLILTNSSAPLLRYETSADDGSLKLNAGGTVNYYFNPISVFGGQKIPIRVHPNLPDGVILGYASQLPQWYKSNETPVVAEVLARQDYYSIDWPIRTRQREYGVYTDSCLGVYAPFAMGVICNASVA